MKKLLQQLFWLVGVITVSEPALAQPVASADVNIVSIDAQNTKKGFVCTTVINNHNDDDSFATKVIVLLPLQTPKVLSATVSGGPGKCAPQSHGGFSEVVQCELGQLPQGPTVERTVTVTSVSSTANHIKQTCGAFVYSLVGDITKTNNYKDATAP